MYVCVMNCMLGRNGRPNSSLRSHALSLRTRFGKDVGCVVYVAVSLGEWLSTFRWNLVILSSKDSMSFKRSLKTYLEDEGATFL
jgi:hypothetical protein